MSASASASSANLAGGTPSTPAGARSGYQPQLDGLRGIAILSVLLHHFDVHLPGMFDWGPIGVRIFFLLSGFLITQSLWRLHAESATGGGYWKGLAAFHGRRMVRLTPVLYTMIGVAVLMGLPEFRQALWWHLGFLSNFYAWHLGKWPDAASHLWSLAVQEQFYLLWPFVILATPRRFLPGLLVALVIAAFAFRATSIAVGASEFARWVMLPGVIDSFALGALVAGWKKAGIPRGFVSGWMGAAVGLAAFAGYALARYLRFGPSLGAAEAVIETLENLFFAWMLVRTTVGWRGLAGWIFANPVLGYVGRISYGLYVFHVLVHVAINGWLNHHGITVQDDLFLRASILLTVSVGVAALSYHYVEMPLTAWVRGGRRDLVPGTVVRPA